MLVLIFRVFYFGYGISLLTLKKTTKANSNILQQFVRKYTTLTILQFI